MSAVLIAVVAIYSIAALVDTALTSHCLTNRDASNCEGGWFRF